MDTETFPRVMKKGVFRGRTFQSHAEYQQALTAVRKQNPDGKRKSPRKRVPTGTYRIEVHTASMHLVIEGDLTAKGDVQDTLLDAIARLPLSE